MQRVFLVGRVPALLEQASGLSWQVPIWWISTTKFELNSSGASKLRPDASAGKPALASRQNPNPLQIIFCISPACFLLVAKGCLGLSVLPYGKKEL